MWTAGIACYSPRSLPRFWKFSRAWITQNGIPVYDPETHTGLLRHIYLRRGEATGEIMACAVVNGDSLPHSEKLIADLQRVDGMKSIVLNRNPNRTNVILGDKCEALWGTPYIEDVLCGVTVRLSPLSFYQVNRAQAQRLYEKAAEYACLTGEETLLDLYCGTGTIGLSMANRVKRLIGAEIVPEAVRDAKINAERNGILNAEFLCADAPEAAEALKNRGIKPDVVILDPPRKGCAPALIDTVCAMRPDRVVYVSCDPATLARDCALFDEKGYRVAEATPVDLFPGTAHVETVALLQKEHC